MDINVQHLKGEQRKGRVRCSQKRLCLIVLIGISSLCVSVLSSLSFLTLCTPNFTSLTSPPGLTFIYKYAMLSALSSSVCGCVCVRVHVQGPGRAHALVPWHRFYQHVGPDMSSHFLSVIAKRASGLAPHDPECNKPCSTRTEKQPHTLARCHPGQMSPV